MFKPVQGILTPIWWTPEAEEGETDLPSFSLQPLTGLQLAEVEDHLSYDEEKGLRVTTPACKLLIKYGLKDWKNFGDNFINFSDALAKMDATLIRTMATKIYLMCVFGEEDEKK